MIDYSLARYCAELNKQSGIVERFRFASDSPDVNLAHRDWDGGFGNVVFTRRGEALDYGNFESPVGAESYRAREYRAFATLEEQRDQRCRFRNRKLDFTLDYDFGDDGFDIQLRGAFPEADQIGLDLNLAMLDLVQDCLPENQFTVNSFSIGRSPEIAYLYCARPGGKGGVLIHSPTPGAKWRVRYLDYMHHSLVGGLQMLFRIAEEFDPAAKAGAVDFRVGISVHDSLAEAKRYLHRRYRLPEISAAALNGRLDAALPFALSGAPCDALELVLPDGSTKILPPDCREIPVGAEGFYHLRAWNADRFCTETVFHRSIAPDAVLKRMRDALEPVPRYCAEGWYWLQSMLLAHRWLGADKRVDDAVYDALIRVLGQGREWPEIAGLPRPPDGESAARLAGYRMPQDETGRYLYYPVSEAHEYEGIAYSPYHLLKWVRIQDAFAFVQFFLTAYEVFGTPALLDYAVTLCDAHLRDHLSDEGKLRCFHGDGRSESDYTTVIVPAQAVCELYAILRRENDSRAERFGEAAIRIAEYLVRRDLVFPTEGCSTHLRWTEDGSIACTALSLLEVYSKVKADPRYLAQARRVMEYHEAWDIGTSDVRTNHSSYRYWETMWEADAEGRDINCGHAWNLWQGEADFLLGCAAGDFDRLCRSYQTFTANFVKFLPDGGSRSSFIPDLLPQRPRRKGLYGCYPESRNDTLAYYFWPRWAATWDHAVAVGCREDGTLAVLNGEVIADDGCHARIRGYGRAPVRLINLSDRNIILEQEVV